MSPTLLAQLRDRVGIDVDSMDPAVATRHSKDARFCGMTSNQGIANAEAYKVDRVGVVQAACKEAKTRLPDGGVEEQISLALDVLTVLLAKDVLPYVEKRVLVQTSPSAAHDTQKTVEHATRLVKLFEAFDIPRSRVCIKIPATPESILACRQLQSSGINTLATCLFSLPQALAASQAGCLYVAPYFNELRVHIEPATWREYKNTAAEHPMSPVIASIVKAYKTIGSPTMVMPASIVTLDEVLALAALNPDHITISPKILDLLALDTTTQLSSVVAPAFDAKIQTDGDYLVNDAALLTEYFVRDTEASRKMADALKIFDDAEQQTKVLIRKELSSL